MIPLAVQAEALKALTEHIYHRSRVNAAAGQVVYEGVPWPEAFERPGWSTQALPVGQRNVMVAVDRSPSSMSRVQDEPPAQLEIERHEVRPLVAAAVWPNWILALGLSEANRRWYIFRWKMP